MKPDRQEPAPFLNACQAKRISMSNSLPLHLCHRIFIPYFKKNCEEALNLMMEEPEDSQVEFRMPETKYDKKKVTEVFFDLELGTLLN